MTDNPFRLKSNDPKRIVGRHNAGQYFDLIEALNDARIDAGITFDELAENLPYDADELRTQLSQSASTLSFLTLHVLALRTGYKYDITLTPHNRQVGTTEAIHEASKDQPDPVVVIHRMADKDD